jgi:NAD(P)H dehydrogenase (quinone)
MRIVVTGATGVVGSRVVTGLVRRGIRPQVVVRDPSRLAEPASVDVRVASGYADTAAMTEAFRGGDALLFVSGRESATRLAEHLSVVEAAADAGISRITYLSFQGAGPHCTFTFGRDHWHTEQAIQDSGFSFSFLRNSFYQEAVAAMCGPDGVIRGPAGDGQVAAVSQDDVATVAVEVLLDDTRHNETLDVTGPEAFTLAQASTVMAEVSGVAVSYVDETEAEAYASRAPYGAPAFEVAGWVSSYQAIAAGELRDVSDTVETVTGRTPRSLRSTLAAHPNLLAHLRGSH